MKKNSGYLVAQVLSEHIENLGSSISLKNLFRSTHTIPFVPPIDRCTHCQTVLKVLKTRTSTVATLAIGTFRAHETILHCPQCGKLYASAELRKLKAYRGRFGYDVMVYVGQAMFLHCRDEREIQQELARRRG